MVSETLKNQLTTSNNKNRTKKAATSRWKIDAIYNSCQLKTKSWRAKEYGQTQQKWNLVTYPLTAHRRAKKPNRN